MAATIREEESKDAMNHDFDHPNALDFKQIEECMRELRKGSGTNIPLYSFNTNAR